MPDGVVLEPRDRAYLRLIARNDGLSVTFTRGQSRFALGNGAAVVKSPHRPFGRADFDRLVAAGYLVPSEAGKPLFDHMTAQKYVVRSNTRPPGAARPFNDPINL
jgi:hypothetical protein